MIGFRRELLAERYAKHPPATINAGPCISCGDPVFVNIFGASAIRERDADVCCNLCEARYDADITKAMVES